MHICVDVKNFQHIVSDISRTFINPNLGALRLKFLDGHCLCNTDSDTQN